MAVKPLAPAAVRTSAAGEPSLAVKRTAPPTFARALFAARSTETFPPDNLVTPEAALAESSEKPAAVAAIAPKPQN